MRKTVAESGLLYISSSPSREHGGFHPEAVRAAKAALRLIAKLRTENKILKNSRHNRNRPA